MDISHLYKPFRNQVRKMDLRLALQRIWAIQRDADRLEGITKLKISVSELHLLCREVLLCADGNEDVLSTRGGLCEMINHIRRIKGFISADKLIPALHPEVHQQIPCQSVHEEARIFRTFHIYNDPELAPIFKESTGISVRDIFLLSLAITGAAKNEPGIHALTDYSGFEVTQEARDNFFKMTGTGLSDIRRNLKEFLRYDERWPFTWNPMEATPLVNTDRSQGHLFWCPLPKLLIRRITEGLFYDLCKGKNESGIKFDNAYGHSFERYVGRVLQKVFDGRFEVLGEQSYKVSGNTRHGVDWVVSDTTGNIFIECKTRRLKQSAKETTEDEELEKSLDALAKVVVQLYKNINDAINKRSKWIPNGRPIYPFVVTYEDWYLFTPQVVNQLNECVCRQLEAAQLPKTLVKTMPFFVTSISEFEMAGQDIAKLNIERFCVAGGISEYRHFQLSALAKTAFPNESIIRRSVLEDSWSEIFPEIQDWSVSNRGGR